VQVISVCEGQSHDLIGVLWLYDVLQPDALLIAELGGVMIGSLVAAWDGWRGSFYKLVVHPEQQRRQGLATELLKEGESRLRALGAGETDRDRRRGRLCRDGVLEGCGIPASASTDAIYPAHLAVST
jgi:ribosomal protein S18 acetylase RimI-like enzyme